MAEQTIYDAIVIGSGASGGWAAKELTESGMQVIVLEAGGPLLNDELLLFQQKFRKKLGYNITADQKALERQPIQANCYAWQSHPHAFVDDINNPYTVTEDKPFTWIRGRQVGGRMRVKSHGRQFYRFSDYELKAASRDGYGEDWPIEYADLAPYYERVERWMALRGTADNIPNLPDSVLLPGVEMTYGDQLLKSAVEQKWEDRRVIGRRTASPPATLPAAMKTKRLTLRPNAVVSHIIIDQNTGKAKGVAFIDRMTHKSHEVFGNIIVLCASTIESTRLLLNSATSQHAAGLGNSSGTLGHFLMDHTFAENIVSRMPIPKKLQVDKVPSWTYIPQFRNISERSPNFIRGYGIQVVTIGDTCQLTGYGEMLPRFENQVTIDQNKKDKWGIPVVKIECAHSDNEVEMARDQFESSKEMVQAAGFEILQENPNLASPGMGIHEVGTARMGNNPQKSVLNKFNQSWDVKNLFITDGACFASQGSQNPTLTIMALTVRACDYIVHQYKQGNL
jgi:choline dehydrogenase-like flavoprotein